MLNSFLENRRNYFRHCPKQCSFSTLALFRLLFYIPVLQFHFQILTEKRNKLSKYKCINIKFSNKFFLCFFFLFVVLGETVLREKVFFFSFDFILLFLFSFYDSKIGFVKVKKHAEKN